MPSQNMMKHAEDLMRHVNQMEQARASEAEIQAGLHSRILSVKQLRLEITGLARHTKSMLGSRELSLAITKMEEAVMWLGKELQRIGETHPDLLKDPYPTSKDPSVPTIDPTAPEIRGMAPLPDNPANR